MIITIKGGGGGRGLLQHARVLGVWPGGTNIRELSLSQRQENFYVWSEATLIMPVVKPQPPPQPTPPLPLPWRRWNSDLVYPGKGSSDVCRDGCWQLLISVTMEISPSPSPPPAVCQSALFAKIAAAAAAVHPPPSPSISPQLLHL